ncbi:MAG: TetR/AcrR family transcriptional regulator [Halioglobus sp.]|nr:TetR/AcrR family transcriptional regulator [Halioglobus sp.]
MTQQRKPSKSEVTRARVIEAAIDCIYAQGFNAAHTNRIAEQAGVSWGVLQYHFGDKDGLLQAVLDSIFADFSGTLADAQLQGDSLQQRVEQLIELVWSLVSKREYRVSLAILRNAGKDESSSIDGEKQVAAWAGEISRLWDRLIAQDAVDAGQSDIARHLMFAALRGMADEINPGGRTRRALVRERQALSRAITHLLCETAVYT